MRINEETLTEYLNKKYAERKDKDNIYGVGISESEFVHFITEYLLPENYVICDPVGVTQANEIILCKILEKYSKKYQKELRRNNIKNKFNFFKRNK